MSWIIMALILIFALFVSEVSKSEPPSVTRAWFDSLREK